jgi:hypothetical protein
MKCYVFFEVHIEFLNITCRRFGFKGLMCSLLEGSVMRQCAYLMKFFYSDSNFGTVESYVLFRYYKSLNEVVKISAITVFWKNINGTLLL